MLGAAAVGLPISSNDGSSSSSSSNSSRKTDSALAPTFVDQQVAAYSDIVASVASKQDPAYPQQHALQSSGIECTTPCDGEAGDIASTSLCAQHYDPAFGAKRMPTDCQTSASLYGLNHAANQQRKSDSLSRVISSIGRAPRLQRTMYRYA